MRHITITFLRAERFLVKPQVGVHVVQDWHSLVRNGLAWPTIGDDKRAAGAICPCALPDGRVKGGRGPVGILAGDVDNVQPGAIERTAEALRNYAAVVAPTFNATLEKPKHRFFVLLSRDLTAEEFPAAWTKMQRELAFAGIDVDRGCKNINRLYYLPVTRSTETWIGARVLTGDPLDADALVQTASEEAEEARQLREAKRAAIRPVAEQHRDKYFAAALSRAAANVKNATEGTRHDTLLREAFALARFEQITDDQIERALLEPFVAAAGEGRRSEGARALVAAIDAGRNAQVAV